ncbi:MAG: hypothetical protein KAX78_11465 [Phycisphaerae bacterium]|nr:hypothetical protein [Phycisphaerae bacterium]
MVTYRNHMIMKTITTRIKLPLQPTEATGRAGIVQQKCIVFGMEALSGFN